jgi:predicted DNA-binding protein (MmcQ/YjbR family)
MTWEELLDCGLAKPGAWQDEPREGDVVAKVGAKICRSGWNTLRIGGAIPDDELTEAIDASYGAVVSKLPKKDRPA